MPVCLRASSSVPFVFASADCLFSVCALLPYRFAFYSRQDLSFLCSHSESCSGGCCSIWYASNIAQTYDHLPLSFSADFSAFGSSYSFWLVFEACTTLSRVALLLDLVWILFVAISFAICSNALNDLMSTCPGNNTVSYLSSFCHRLLRVSRETTNLSTKTNCWMICSPEMQLPFPWNCLHSLLLHCSTLKRAER